MYSSRGRDAQGRAVGSYSYPDIMEHPLVRSFCYDLECMLQTSTVACTTAMISVVFSG